MHRVPGGLNSQSVGRRFESFTAQVSSANMAAPLSVSSAPRQTALDEGLAQAMNQALRGFLQIPLQVTDQT